MITIHGKTYFTTYKESTIPYIEPEVKEEPSYHSFKMISTMQIPTGSIIKTPKLSTLSILSGKVSCQYGFTPSDGLGSKAQGNKKPIIPLAAKRRHGIGYITESSNNHQG